MTVARTITIVTDGCDDAAGNPLMNFLHSSAMGVKFVDCINTTGESKTAEYIAGLCIKQIEDAGPENVVQVCTI
jgi:hypothetical protein